MLFHNEEYIKLHTVPYNPLNRYLHEHWEPYAQKYGLKAYFKSGPEYRDETGICLRFSCSIPSERALNTIALFGPVLEIGSGTGFWAYLLKTKKVDILAVDNWIWDPCWYPETIIQDGYTFLLNNVGCADRSLMLCWPTCSLDVLEAYKGHTLILMPNPDPVFRSCFNTMERCREWRLIHKIDLPFWPGNNDVCLIYQRKKQRDAPLAN